MQNVPTALLKHNNKLKSHFLSSTGWQPHGCAAVVGGFDVWTSRIHGPGLRPAQRHSVSIAVFIICRCTHYFVCLLCSEQKWLELKQKISNFIASVFCQCSSMQHFILWTHLFLFCQSIFLQGYGTHYAAKYLINAKNMWNISWW